MTFRDDQNAALPENYNAARPLAGCHLLAPHDVNERPSHRPAVVIRFVVYALYRLHGASVAGTVRIAASFYELTPLKRACRRRCRDSVGLGIATVL